MQWLINNRVQFYSFIVKNKAFLLGLQMTVEFPIGETDENEFNDESN